MVKIVFLNGPPRVGKDTLANELLKLVPGALHHKFSKPLKDCFRAMYGCMDEKLVENLLEEYKDVSDPRNFGNWDTPRGFQIALSEKFVKTALGKDGFGKLALLRLRSATVQHAFLSDCGFVDECLPIIKHFGASSCHLVRLSRDGCTFDNDSRSYIELPLPAKNIHEIDNQFDKKTESELFLAQVKLLWRKING